MLFRRFLRKSVFGILLLSSAIADAEIDSLEDLRDLETKVKAVAKRSMMATVSLISPDRASSGSGVLVTKEGLILTAAHVVDGYPEMVVVFPDGNQERGRVLGANYSRDAAMVQIMGNGNWPSVEIGDSSLLGVGDFVVAMGHPKGFDPTRKPPVRFGRIMTRRGRGFLTTDCPLIGGDSGGPLFDLTGRLVGIHSHIVAEDRVVNNHAEISGFQRSWNKMLAGRRWGLLGMERRNDLDRPIMGVILENFPNGVMKVGEIPRNSPALEAGIRQGDEILRIAGEPVRGDLHIQEILMDYEPGDKVEVEVGREGGMIRTSIKLASARQVYQRRRR